jgi:hypothetical protein
VAVQRVSSPNRSWRRVLVLLLIGASSLCWFSPAAVAAAGGPAIAESRARVNPGQRVVVTGSGFAPLDLLSVSICGDRGLLGAQDCDLTSQATLLADGGGGFVVGLRVNEPPSPCPCVVEVDADQGVYRLPLAIHGVQSAPVQAPAALLAPHVVVTSQHLDPDSRLRTWFGLPTTLTFTLTVLNDGGGVAEAPILVLDRQTRLGQITVNAPRMADLAPGQSRTLHVPVPIGPLSVGHVVVSGSVQLPLGKSTVRGSMLVLPWAWVAGLVGGALVLVLRAQRRPPGRHRIVRHHERGRRWSTRTARTSAPATTRAGSASQLVHAQRASAVAANVTLRGSTCWAPVSRIALSGDVLNVRGHADISNIQQSVRIDRVPVLRTPFRV